MVTKVKRDKDYYAIPVIGPAVETLKPRIVGYATGCFVGFHEGHKAFLKKASELECLDTLVVFMDSDAHVIEKWTKKGLDIRYDYRLKSRFFEAWEYLAALEKDRRKSQPNFKIRLVYPCRGSTTSESFFLTLRDTIYMFCRFNFIMIEDYMDVEKWQDKYISELAYSTYIETLKDSSGKKISSKKEINV